MKEEVGYEEFLAMVYGAETDGTEGEDIECKGKGYDSEKSS